MSSKLLHLQGLRSLAIIVVVLFHFFPQLFPNGYLGVDQFFLLSGYLMTMMMEKNRKLSTGALLEFFYRRVKRIIPLYYLATLIILLSVNYTPINTWKTNSDSAIYALLFSTNLIRPTGLEGYNEKLGMGVDMFTHTWSLSLEMQFYFLFPLIFYPVQMFRNRSKTLCLSLFVVLSFLYHAFADEFISFYSISARIWQFSAGSVIYYESNRQEQRNLKLELEESASKSQEGQIESKELSLCETVTFVCLTATIVLFISREQIGPLAARIVTILMTMLIVQVGERCWLLQSRVMVFVGEISYSWYLVHWPVVAQLKMHGLESQERK